MTTNSAKFGWLSLALYCASLALDAVSTEMVTYSGFALLGFGLAGVVFNANFAWLANVTFFLTFAFWRKSRWISLSLSVGSLLLSLTSFSLETIGLDQVAKITGYGAGLYLWLASHLVLVGAVAMRPNSSFAPTRMDKVESAKGVRSDQR